ncbi:MAG: ADP-ribosylglycohydrolase family protein [Chloroflexota bacterium]
MQAMQRAFTALQGTWIGDAFGGHFEFESVDWHRPERTAQTRQLPPATWRYTDDTQMALSVYDILRRHGRIMPEKLVTSFGEHFDISRGYGIGTEQLLLDIRAGGEWETLAQARFDGKGSAGNGAAMRVAPIGAYFAEDLNAVVHNARQSAITTHTHPEGIAGAIAVAAATTVTATQQDTKPFLESHYWETIIAHTPDSRVKDKLIDACNLASDCTSKQAAKQLGSGWDVLTTDTVPYALWCAVKHVNSFEDAMWEAIRVGGDTDTVAAIVGGIVASHIGLNYLPKSWVERCEPLPQWMV